MTDNLDEILVTRFRFYGFRNGQKDAIRALQDGRDCICIMPTGAGKSLIYQFYSILNPEKLVIVISPLISLMKDQVDSIRRIGLDSEYCNSSQTEVEQLQVFGRAVQGKINILFLSPEKALSSFVIDMMKKMKIALLAIDEAHCISQWGHDFRPEYSKIYRIRNHLNLQKFPIIALTATATSKVQNDIIESLNLVNPKVIVNSFVRNNLILKVSYFESDIDKLNNLLDIIHNHNKGRLIVYCSTRQKVEEVNKFLNENGIKSGKYHAGQSEIQRRKIQNSYSSGKINILIATNAFGMGIDHPDVRYVVHFQVPASIEAYYQEAGRAGRDGKSAECILFYKSSDFNIRRYLSLKSGDKEDKSVLLESLKLYCHSKECRQKYICKYFGEVIDGCRQCDNCKGENEKINKVLEKEQKIIDDKILKSNYQFTNAEKETVINALTLIPGKFGKNIIIDFLRGSQSSLVLRRKLNILTYYGSLKHIPELSIKRLMEQLINSGEIKLTIGKYPKLYIPGYLPITKSKSQKISFISDEQRIIRDLRNFRDREARKNKWKKYMILQNSVIQKIAKMKPKSNSELIMIKGIGEDKIKKYGDIILKTVKINIKDD